MDIDDPGHKSTERGLPTMKELALQIFVKKYSFTLTAGASQWLEDLMHQFEMTEINAVTSTFDHIASACRAGVGKYLPLSQRNSN